MKVVFGCDPNATQFKLDLMEYVKSLGHEVADLGSDDPIYANTAIDDVYQAQRAQLSNHANIITMGSQVIGIELAKQLVKEYLSVEWDPNCRSVAKVQRIIDFENEE